LTQVNPAGYVILGALAVVLVVIALAWFLVLRRLDEGNFETGGPLHPPWTPARRRFFRRGGARRVPRKAVVLGREIEDEQAPLQAWSAERQLEREEHAGTSKALDEAKDRNTARPWGG
jgi:hypothetical protein